MIYYDYASSLPTKSENTRSQLIKYIIMKAASKDNIEVSLIIPDVGSFFHDSVGWRKFSILTTQE